MRIGSTHRFLRAMEIHSAVPCRAFAEEFASHLAADVEQLVEDEETV